MPRKHVNVTLPGGTIAPELVPAQSWASLTGKPTTIAGFGITDALTTAQIAALYQPVDADLTAIAGLGTTAFGRGLLTEVDASTARVTLSVYSTAQVDAADAAITATLTAHTSNTSNPHSVTKSQVGLGSVENTALSTWAGTSNLTTLGTITTGTWQGAAIANAYLANSAITIAGTSASLGGSITLDTIDNALAANGLIARTAANTRAARTITGTTNRLAVTNGDGVSGNPTLDISSSYVGQATITTVGTLTSGSINWSGNIATSGSGSFGTTLLVNRNAVAAPTPSATNILQLVAADSESGNFTLDTFGATPFIYGRRAGGTNASKTATLSGNNLLAISGRGYQAVTPAYSNDAARILFQAAENFTDVAQGANILFQVNAVGGSSIATVATLSSTGLSLGSNSLTAGAISGTTGTFTGDMLVSRSGTAATVNISRTDSGATLRFKARADMGHIGTATNHPLRFYTNEDAGGIDSSTPKFAIGDSSGAWASITSTGLSVTGGISATSSVSGYSGAELRLLGGAGTENAIATTTTGAPIMLFDHRGTSNTGSWRWRNGTSAATQLMQLDNNGLYVGGFKATKTGSNGFFAVTTEGANSYNTLTSRNFADGAYLDAVFRFNYLTIDNMVNITNAGVSVLTTSASGVSVTGTLGASGNVTSSAGGFYSRVSGGINMAAGSAEGLAMYYDFNVLQASRSSGVSLELRRTTSDGGIANFYRDTTNVGSISVSSTSTSYNTSSDARLKTDLGSFTLGDIAAPIYALSGIMRKYAWDVWLASEDEATRNRAAYGWFAQEAQTVAPWMVHYDAQGDRYSISPMSLIPNIVACLGVQKTELDSHKSEIDLLKEENVALKARVLALETA